MIPRSVKAPTIPIPFHRLLKIVAIVDPADVQAKELIELIRAENYEVEVTDRVERDLHEDASVGAYIAAVDGSRREGAKRLALEVRALGFDTPLWALADSHQIADLAVVGGLGEVDGYIYLGQQTPAFYAKQVIASLVKYGLGLLPPFFGGMMAYDSNATIAFDCPGHQGGQFYKKSPAGQMFFKHFGEAVFRNDLCNADVDLGDLLIHEGAAAEAQKHAARIFRRRPHVLRAERHQYLEQSRDRCAAEARRSRAVRPQQPQVAAPGWARSGGRNADLPADRAQSVRHDRRGGLGRVGREVAARTDPQKSTRHRQIARRCAAPVPTGVHSALYIRRHRLQREEGARSHRPSLRLRAVGRSVDRLQRVPSAVRGPQPDASEGSVGRFARTLLDAIRAQAARRLFAGIADPQAR
jgi:hypothetical protein